jgi:DNA ligase 1
LSPVYPAAMSHLGGERGLSMRFPRFIRVRDDKTWEEATTAAQFAGMYRKQIAAAPPRGTVPVEALEEYEEDGEVDVDML